MKLRARMVPVLPRPMLGAQLLGKSSDCVTGLLEQCGRSNAKLLSNIAVTNRGMLEPVIDGALE